ncbi:hypothetical protein MMA15_20625 [Streptomyces sp. M600PL45_2]|uniref:Hydrogenase expression protein HypF n=1 Tax=Streptomyces marispadix TaxID=2922868 RepID=A0ABS9T2D8_9ACTN|nr:hypothetical protein [Streptomyces marispadix]MCH6162705.1 hypothetical protein [Streptomyces marispadix]
MPSAVLMGMGLTPQLASAKPLPKNPFKGGSCVSQPDKDENADEQAKEKAEREKAEKEKEQDEAGKPGSGSSKPGSGSGSSKPEPSPSPSGDGGGSGGSGGSEDPSPSPSPSEPDEDEDEGDDDGGLLGGVGDAIGDILSPEEKEEKAEEEKAEEAKQEEEKASSDSDSTASKAGKPVEDAVGKVGDGLKDTTDKLGEGVEKVGEDAKDKLPTAGDKAAQGKAGKDGKAFPCVEEKKSAGKDEQTPNTLPNDPWTLKASSLGLHGLDYKGVVNIRTQDGRTKQALKFTASSVDIGDLHQIVKGPDGTNYHVQAAKGSTSTIRGGKVTMYTERLKGNLFGLIPIVFDPEHPPPLNIPEAYFTNVEVSQAGQFGGNLTVPGLHQTID